jgi:hypothetical protein
MVLLCLVGGGALLPINMRAVSRARLATNLPSVRAFAGRRLAVSWSRPPSADAEDLGEYYEYEDYEEGIASDATNQA